MTRRFFSGSTLDQAVMMAARHYGVDPKELAYRQIEKRHGFLRTRKAVMIAVDPDQPSRRASAPTEGAVALAEPLAPAAIEPGEDLDPQRETEPQPHAQAEVGFVSEPERATDGGTGPAELAGAEAPAAATEWRDREPQTPPASADGWDLPAGGEVELAAGDRDEEGEETAPREPVEAEEEAEQDEELLDAAERAARVLLRFAGIDAEASSHSGPERVEVELEGPDSSVLVVENGTGLLAIQHLLPRMMRGLTGRSSFVRVDSEGFHGKRKERLQALARKEAEAVSRDGGRRTLPPMAPDERRIVHLAVQEIPTVETESEGSGLHKRVVIRPVAADGGHNDVEARHGF